MYMYIGWENALRPELNQVINQKRDHKIRNILIKRAGIRYIALPCLTLGKWKRGGLQHVFISILNRVGFYQAILLTTPLVITAHLNSFPAGCFLLCWRPRVGPWVGCKKERDACSDMKDLHTKAWKGTGGSDIWELIQAQPCGSANTSIRLRSWGFGLDKFSQIWPLAQDLLMIWTQLLRFCRWMIWHRNKSKYGKHSCLFNVYNKKHSTFENLVSWLFPGYGPAFV